MRRVLLHDAAGAVYAFTGDDAEVARFAVFLRLVGQAEAAGATAEEAAHAVFDDLYGGPAADLLALPLGDA